MVEMLLSFNIDVQQHTNKPPQKNKTKQQKKKKQAFKKKIDNLFC